MARKKKVLLPWLSSKPDGAEKRFIQVGNSLLFNEAFQQLNAGSQMLYLRMAMESGGQREVAFSRKTAEKYGIPRNSFSRQIKELKETGFIEVSMEGNMWQFKPSVYRFSFSWKQNPQPQNCVSKSQN